MALMSLIARLGLDTKDYERGMERAKKSNFDFEANIEKGIGKKIRKFFGLGVVMLGVNTLKHATVGASTEMQALADASDITVSQLLRLQRMASSNGESWEKFRKEIESTGETLKEFADRKAPGDEIFDSEAASARQGWFKPLLKKIGLGGLSNFNGGLFYNSVVSGLRSWMGLDDENAKHAALANPFEDKNAKHWPDEAGSGESEYFNKPLNAFRRSFRTDRPNANALQQVGAFSAVTQETIELREAVRVLRQMDGTLKRIDQKSSENIVLAP